MSAEPESRSLPLHAARSQSLRASGVLLRLTVVIYGPVPEVKADPANAFGFKLSK